jgi:hypothetical protein
MRHRPAMIVAAAAAALAALPAYAAGMKTLDGKATKSLAFADKISAAQDNDADIASTSDRTRCSEPRCSKFSFRYAPAKGIKAGALSVKISWTFPVEDYDLYVVQDNAGTVGKCGAGAGTSEAVVIDKPVPGHVYTVVVDHYRAIPDTVAVKVQFPTTQKIMAIAPSAVENNVEPVNCGIS